MRQLQDIPGDLGCACGHCPGAACSDRQALLVSWSPCPYPPAGAAAPLTHLGTPLPLRLLHTSHVWEQTCNPELWPEGGWKLARLPLAAAFGFQSPALLQGSADTSHLKQFVQAGQ